MVASPATGAFLAQAGRFNSAMGPVFEAFLAWAKQLPGGGEETTLTVSSGRIIPTGFLHKLETEGAAATDDLTSIATTNLPAGSLLLLRNADSTRKTTLRHQEGTAGERIFMAKLAHYQLGSSATRILLYRDTSQWLQFGPPWFASDDAAMRSYFGFGAAATYATASTAEIATGTATDRLLTPAGIAAFLKPIESAEFGIGSANIGSHPHGLGLVPARTWAVLRCKTAQHGYVAGNELPIESFIVSEAPRAVQLWADATDIGFAYVNQGPAMAVIPATGGAPVGITVGNWRLVLRCTRW